MQILPFLIPALVLAISFHEWAHAMAAHKLGDDTAKQAGRLTLNPLAHLDLLGTIMLFLVHFGWGKPVPVNPRNFRRPVWDNIVVAFCGPLSNLVLALISLLLLKHLPSLPLWLGTFLTVFYDLNIFLMIFNLLPIPPLDGGHVLEIFASNGRSPLLSGIYRYGPVILVSILLVESVFNVPLLSRVLIFLHQVVTVGLYAIT